MDNINDLKGLVNEITDLTNGDYHYDIKGRSGLSEEDEIYFALRDSVYQQLWSLSWKQKQNHGETYAIPQKIIYRGKNEDDLEKNRWQIRGRIKAATDPLEKISIFYQEGRKLVEEIKAFDLLNCASETCRSLLSAEICGNAFKQGVLSITQIQELMPWLKISDIYGLSKMLKYDITITDQELEIAKEEYLATGEPKVLKDLFGEAPGAEQKQMRV